LQRRLRGVPVVDAGGERHNVAGGAQLGDEGGEEDLEGGEEVRGGRGELDGTNAAGRLMYLAVEAGTVEGVGFAV
jgi:hypothetical protein